MKAKLMVQVQCGECNSQMNYHEEGKFIRCNGLKCPARHINYLAPTIELIKEKLDESAKPAGKSKATKA